MRLGDTIVVIVGLRDVAVQGITRRGFGGANPLRLQASDGPHPHRATDQAEAGRSESMVLAINSAACLWPIRSVLMTRW